MLFAPPRLKVLKNLKVVKLGKNITCGILRQPRQHLTTFFPSPARKPFCCSLLSYVVLVVVFFFLRQPRQLLTTFFRAMRGNLCCLLLFLLSFSPFRSEPVRKLVVVPSCYLLSFYSFRNYFYAIFSIAFVSSYFFISSSRFSRQTNEPPFFMRLTICCSFSLSCDLPFSALRSIGLDTILNINL